MNVLCLLALSFIFLTGCTPGTVSLNAEFGLSSDSFEEPKPSGSFTILSNPTQINSTNQSSIDLKGTCEHVDRVQLKLNGVSFSEISCTQKLWETQLDLSNLPDGIISFDFIDNKSLEKLKQISLEKDTVAPTAFLALAPPAINNLDQVSISFDLTSGLSHFSVKAGDAISTDCSDSQGYSSYNEYQVVFTHSVVNDGPQKLCLLGRDTFGNEQPYASATVITWTKDSVDPLLSFHSSSSSSYVNNANVSAFSFAAHCSETGQLATLTAKIADIAIQQMVSCPNDNIARATMDLSALADGTIEFKAAQTDAAGNSAQVVILTALKDTVIPNITGSVSDGEFTNSLLNTPTITWPTATDSGSGFDYYSIGIGTTNDTTNVLNFTDVSSSFNSFNYYSVSPIFSEGTRYYAILNAFDRAGNVKRIYGDGWVPDISGPTISAINDGTVSSPGITPITSWSTANDGGGSGVNSYYAAIGTSPGNNDILNWIEVVRAEEVQITNNFINLGGTYFISIKAKDNVGNFGPVIQGDGFKVKNLITSKVVSNEGAVAAVLKTGKVIVWGDASYGGSYISLPSSLKFGFRTTTSISSSYAAFAAIQNDGSVITWGDSLYGGDSSSVSSQLNGGIDVLSIASTKFAFAAIRTDGSVVTWGDSAKGGDSSAIATDVDGTNDVVEIKSTTSAFAARRADGSVVTWGHPLSGGTIPSIHVLALNDVTNKVTRLYSTGSSFIALREDGSLISWGSSTMDSLFASAQTSVNGSIPVIDVVTNANAAAARRSDGSVIAWGQSDYGGNSSTAGTALNGDIDVETITASGKAFLALRSDKSAVAWGNSSNGGVIPTPISILIGSSNPVVSVASTYHAFAVIRFDGSVLTWGNTGFGGDSSTVTTEINGSISPVVSIASTATAFAALRQNGSVVKWGESFNGGDNSEQANELTGSPTKVVQIFSNNSSFTALREDGTFITWGSVDYGGNSSAVNP